MRKELRLLKNFGILTFGNASIKFFSFLLIPIYTSVLSTEEFSIFELIISTVGLLVPIVTFDIADATLRFCMDASYKNSEIFNLSLKYCGVGVGITSVLMVVNHIFNCVFFLLGREILFVAIFSGTAFLGVLVAFAKGSGKVKETAISGVIGSITTIVVNIVLLVLMQMGITGYFIAYISGQYFQIIYLIFVVKPEGEKKQLWKKCKNEHEIIGYSVPLIFNNIAWWVNNALDRYFVTAFRGMAENGIYSVSYKIPSLISLVQSIFHQAWTLSVIQEYENDDSQKYILKMYRLYNFVLVMLCGEIIVFNKMIARIMYAKEFYNAWEYVPYLCIGFVFLGLANYMGGIFNAIKKSNIIAYTTIVGAVINCILNCIFIPLIGALGASVATCISYSSIWIVRAMAVDKYLGLRFFSSRDIITYGILILEAVITLRTNLSIGIIQLFFGVLIVIIYKNECFSTIDYLFLFIGIGGKHKSEFDK